MVGAGTYGDAGSARSGKGEGDGSANSLGGPADEDVFAMEVGFATVDCLVSIAVQSSRVVISWDQGQSYVSKTAAMSTLPGPAKGL